MDGHQHERLSDEALEHEIEAALGVDPSPEFLPRIRARIASEGIRPGWRWPLSWRWAGAIAVPGAVVIGAWLMREPAAVPRETQVALGPKIEPSQPAPVGASTPAVAPVVVPVKGAARSPRPRGAATPEIVISPDEAVALRQLVVAIAARQVVARDIPELGVESAPLPPLEELVLEPIKLSPLGGLESE
jgi:hypothetical protein